MSRGKTNLGLIQLNLLKYEDTSKKLRLKNLEIELFLKEKNAFGGLILLKKEDLAQETIFIKEAKVMEEEIVELRKENIILKNKISEECQGNIPTNYNKYFIL